MRRYHEVVLKDYGAAALVTQPGDAFDDRVGKSQVALALDYSCRAEAADLARIATHLLYLRRYRRLGGPVREDHEIALCGLSVALQSLDGAAGVLRPPVHEQRDRSEIHGAPAPLSTACSHRYGAR